MYLRRLSLTDFRCYRRLDVTLPCGTIVLVGRNAQGKTSILEACYVLATTRSPLTTTDRELIHWAAAEEVMPFSRVWGEVALAGGHQTVEVLNVRQAVEQGEERFAKRLRVNNVPRRALDVLGLLNVVLFSPHDLELVDGAPSERRLYLDVLLCQIDRVYCTALSRYNRVLVQRNHLLRRLRERGGNRSELEFWNDQLISEGAVLLERRLATVLHLGELAAEIHAELVGPAASPLPGAELANGHASPSRLALAYRSTAHGATPSVSRPRGAVGGAGWLAEAGAPYPASNPPLPGLSGPAAAPGPPGRAELAAQFASVLAERTAEEIARGMTVVGPHRDDLAFSVDGVNMRTYGSRGQQRTVVLALKLAEARLMWSTTGERPVLLLDDVLSELDGDRRRFLLSHVDPQQQTLITTTDLANLPEEFLAGALVLEVEGGQIVRAQRAGRAVTVPVG